MRSAWKGQFHFLEKVSKKSSEFRSRSSYVLPTDVGVRVSIHDGKKLNQIQVRPSMVGLKFGAFFVTKRLGSIHLAPSNSKSRSSSKKK